MRSRPLPTALLLAALAAPAAQARDFRLRADLVGASAFPSVDIDRSSDGYLHLDLEVELPLWRAFTLGARGTPLFLYHPGGEHWIYGLGFGLTTRAYLRGAIHTGPFAGIAVTTLRTNREFDGDTSRLNFLSQLSFGWQSPDQHWHAMATFEHISNAWTTESNHGVNGLGASVGIDW